jgi:hypothetical protein
MTIINALPFDLLNGTTADATQVDANFNEIVNDVNNNGAHNGVNSDITALTALTTPIPPAGGGTNVFVGGTSTGVANAQIIATPVPSGFTLTIGNRIVWEPGFTNTGALTLVVNGTTATAVLKPTATGLAPLTGGEVFLGQAAEAYFDGTEYVLFTNANPPVPTKFLQNYLAGLVLSTAGGSGTFGISAGEASDSTNVASMLLASAYTKTTASWAVGTGNGGLDTGAIANSTWYHVFVIQRVDTGVVDILFSLSPSAPTLPTGYTLFRRIGSMKTDTSAHWFLFYQFADQFLWDAPPTDLSNFALNATPVAKVLSTPLGVFVLAQILVELSNSTTNGVAKLYYPNGNAQSAGAPNAQIVTQVNGVAVAVEVQVRTNASSQIEAVGNASVNNSLSLVTVGWFDSRGR